MSLLTDRTHKNSRTHRPCLFHRLDAAYRHDNAHISSLACFLEFGPSWSISEYHRIIE